MLISFSPCRHTDDLASCVHERILVCRGCPVGLETKPGVDFLRVWCKKLVDDLASPSQLFTSSSTREGRRRWQSSSCPSCQSELKAYIRKEKAFARPTGRAVEATFWVELSSSSSPVFPLFVFPFGRAPDWITPTSVHSTASTVITVHPANSRFARTILLVVVTSVTRWPDYFS